MSIKIITDTGCDLPNDLIQKYNIEVIPLLVQLGSQEYEDGKTIHPKELYGGMRNGSVYQTAQPSLGRFKEVFTHYAKNKECCIYLAFSSGLSGAYQSSMMMRTEILDEYADFDLDIIDTKCATTGFGLVVLKAAQMSQNGASKSEILEAIQFYTTHMEHIFTVDNLEYLYRGGRLSRTAALIGGLLNIKPVLNVEDGKLVPVEKVRGKKALFKRMIQLIEKRGVDLSNQTIGIAHGDDIEGANHLKELIQERFGCENFLIDTIGCAIGAHAGPGTLAIFFLNEKSPI